MFGQCLVILFIIGSYDTVVASYINQTVGHGFQIMAGIPTSTSTTTSSRPTTTSSLPTTFSRPTTTPRSRGVNDTTVPDDMLPTNSSDGDVAFFNTETSRYYNTTTDNKFFYFNNNATTDNKLSYNNNNNATTDNNQQSTLRTTPSTITTSTRNITFAPTTKPPTTFANVTTTTTKPTTGTPYGISTTTENHNVSNELIELVEKRQKENTIETRKLASTHANGKNVDQKSWTIALSVLVLGVVLHVVAALALRLWWSARGRDALAKLRGASDDPEIQYQLMSADNDEC